MDEITILQAEVLRTLANPRRLEILHRLAEGPCEVGKLAEEIGASQPNVSQHLSVLRNAGIVEAERDGREVRYRLTDPDVITACAVMRGVLQRRLSRLRRLDLKPGGTKRARVQLAKARLIVNHQYMCAHAVRSAGWAITIRETVTVVPVSSPEQTTICHA